MPQPLPDDIKAAEAYAADQFLTMPEALEMVALITSEVETLRKDRDRLIMELDGYKNKTAKK